MNVSKNTFFLFIILFFGLSQLHASKNKELQYEKMRKAKQLVDKALGMESSKTKDKDPFPSIEESVLIQSPWKEVSTTYSGPYVDTSNKASISTENRQYSEKDIKKFIMTLNNDPKELDHYQKLVEAGKKYVLLLFYYPYEKACECLYSICEDMKRIYNWQTISINPSQTATETFPIAFLDCGISKSMGLITYPAIILIDLKKNTYKIIHQGTGVIFMSEFKNAIFNAIEQE